MDDFNKSESINTNTFRIFGNRILKTLVWENILDCILHRVSQKVVPNFEA